jgi:hypothetical protein
VIKRTFWACATITSYPSAVNNRLTHGECLPVSIAMRHRGMLPNTCFMASEVVASLRSKTIFPASFKTRYALERSPGSTPIVSCPWKRFFRLACIVLIFCVAGLLFHCASSTSNTLGAHSIPPGDRPSPSHLVCPSVTSRSGQPLMTRVAWHTARFVSCSTTIQASTVGAPMLALKSREL